MCGIAGLLAVNGEQAKLASEVADMAATLSHRGPDDEGLAVGDGWAVAMRRLAVQDTSHAGHQPMSFGGLTLVFNGEVYNFPELRRELQHSGERFHSGSDTEVVLHALRRWGADALRRFNGMFALALIDHERRRALLARDRFGKKPLFVARLRGGLAFASELKAIMRIAAQELTIDRRALADYFRFQYVPTPISIFERVEKLPAASYAEMDLDSGVLSAARSYWSLPVAARSEQPASPVEVLEVVRESVKRRMLADVPVGAFLSGGVDSSMVVACMCEVGTDVRTYSIGFDDPRFDEAQYATAVADHFGCNHTNLRLSSQDALQLLPDFVKAYDEPFADSSAIPTMAVSRLAREDVTVALSGDGGDELFGGYNRYRIARLHRLASATPGVAAKALGLFPVRGPLGRRARAFSELAAAGGQGAIYREAVSIWPTPQLRNLMPEVGDVSSCDSFFAKDGGSVERMMRCDARTYLIDDILQKVDRASMSISLEARNPLLDPEVVEIAFRSTGFAESEPGRKPLLRSALSLRLPDHLVDRPKKGFGVPVGDWMRNQLRPLVEDFVLGCDEADYDLPTAKQVCHEHLSGTRDATAQLWSLLVYEMWRHRWHPSSAKASL